MPGYCTCPQQKLLSDLRFEHNKRFKLYFNLFPKAEKLIAHEYRTAKTAHIGLHVALYYSSLAVGRSVSRSFRESELQELEPRERPGYKPRPGYFRDKKTENVVKHFEFDFEYWTI